jgi:hypothetical protein
MALRQRRNDPRLHSDSLTLLGSHPLWKLDDKVCYRLPGEGVIIDDISLRSRASPCES